jgi:DNA replication protein DnaC
MTDDDDKPAALDGKPAAAPCDDAEPETHDAERLSREETPGDLARRVLEKYVARTEANGIVPPPAEDLSAARDARLRLLLGRKIRRGAAEIIVDGQLKETTALEHAKAFLEKPFGTLVLSGGKGCGKTVAASWAIAQRCPQRYVGDNPNGRDGCWPPDLHARFLDIGELARLAKYDGEKVIPLLRDCWLLAIDDVGMEVADDRFAGFLDELIVKRHDDHLWTIMTTNLPALRMKGTSNDAFLPRYGVRIVDRIKDRGGYAQIDEPSMRGA